MARKTFRISDMHCTNCVMRLEGIEDDLDGVRSVRASYQKQQMEVDWDERRMSEAQIVSAIQRLGYTVDQAR